MNTLTPRFTFQGVNWLGISWPYLRTGNTNGMTIRDLRTGAAVVGPLKCRMKQNTQTNREDQPGRSLQPTERILQCQK